MSAASGTQSPPLSKSTPMGTSNVKGDRSKGIPDAEQRGQYFQGESTHQDSGAAGNAASAALDAAKKTAEGIEDKTSGRHTS